MNIDIGKIKLAIAEKKKLLTMFDEHLQGRLPPEGKTIKEEGTFNRYNKAITPLIANLLEDKNVDINIGDFESDKELLFRIIQLAKITVELNNVIYLKSLSTLTRLYIFCVVYNHSYEIIIDYLRPFSKKVNDHYKYVSNKSLKEKSEKIVEVFKRYDKNTSDVFETVNHSIRSSIAHNKYKIDPDKKEVHFKYYGGEKNLCEMQYMIGRIQTLMMSILYSVTKHQLGFFENWAKMKNE